MYLKPNYLKNTFYARIPISAVPEEVETVVVYYSRTGVAEHSLSSNTEIYVFQATLILCIAFLYDTQVADG